MQYRRLGKTNLMVSAIGYGTWGFANDPDTWVGATWKDSEQALRLALDNGLNFIDTARIYGNGLAEEWLGKILNQSHQDVIVASKMYPLNHQWSGMKDTRITDAFPKSHIINLVHQSLKALNREYLDVMYFHVWEDAWAHEEEWQDTVKNLTKEGKVRYWGISTNDFEPTNCLEACETGLISVVMTIFNLFYQEPVQLLFPIAKKLDLGVVARVPLDEGGLSGKLTPNTRFPDGDFRQIYFSPERLLQLEKHISKLQLHVDGKIIKSLPELALRYILSFLEISATVPGMRKAAHVQENLAVADQPLLDEQMLKELSLHAWNRNFYD